MTHAGFPIGAGGLICPHALRPLQKAGLWAAGGRQATPGPQGPGSGCALTRAEVSRGCPSFLRLSLARTFRGPCCWLRAQKQWEVHQPAWWEGRTDVRLLFSPRRPIIHWVTDALFSGEVAAGPASSPCAPSLRPRGACSPAAHPAQPALPALVNNTC